MLTIQLLWTVSLCDAFVTILFIFILFLFDFFFVFDKRYDFKSQKRKHCTKNWFTITVRERWKKVAQTEMLPKANMKFPSFGMKELDITREDKSVENDWNLFQFPSNP